MTFHEFCILHTNPLQGVVGNFLVMKFCTDKLPAAFLCCNGNPTFCHKLLSIMKLIDVSPIHCFPHRVELCLGEREGYMYAHMYKHMYLHQTHFKIFTDNQQTIKIKSIASFFLYFLHKKVMTFSFLPYILTYKLSF